MFLDAIGIVLKKNNFSDYKITMYDKVQGKIECIATSINLSIGSLVTYSLQYTISSLFMNNSKLLYMPFHLAKTDILFFHFVLEIIYYFSYINNPSEVVFELLQFLYVNEEKDMTVQFKKLFLFKLLIGLDHCIEYDTSSIQFTAILNQISLKDLFTTHLDLTTEKRLDSLLWCCMYEHPYVNKFKTIHFLSINRAI